MILYIIFTNRDIENSNIIFNDKNKENISDYYGI